MFRDYMNEIYERFQSEDTMYDTIDIISDIVDVIQQINPDIYNSLLSKLEEYLYNISIDDAKKIVSKMSNEYGMSGGRWTYEEICDAANQYQLPETINRCELYIVMNMWATDFQRTMKHFGLENKLDAYVMFSCDWLTDSDFGKGKVYKYFIKNKEN